MAVGSPVSQGAQPAPVTNASTYQFIVGWIFLFVILIVANRTRLGHVIIYYSLMLIILLILVTEYARITPFLNAIQTPGQFNG